MGDLPQYLDAGCHRDRTQRVELAFRWTFVAALTAFLCLALANVFGQSAERARAGAPAGELEVLAPTALRSGLYYEARFTIDAREELKDATVVLGRGWLDGITVNTIEPSPLGEASRGGALALRLGHVARGERYVLYVQSQVNPTTSGARTLQTDLLDGPKRLARVRRLATIFP